MIKVGIIGATGYAGAELFALLQLTHRLKLWLLAQLALRVRKLVMYIEVM